MGEWTRDHKIASISAVFAALGVLVAIVALFQGSDDGPGNPASQSDAAGCPTLRVPGEIRRGAVFVVENADGYQPGEEVDIVLSAEDGSSQVLRTVYARSNGSFAGTNLQVPTDASIGDGEITVERESGGDCEMPSADVTVY